MRMNLVYLSNRGRSYTRVTEFEPDDEYTVENDGLGQEAMVQGDDFQTWK